MGRSPAMEQVLSVFERVSQEGCPAESAQFWPVRWDGESFPLSAVLAVASAAAAGALVAPGEKRCPQPQPLHR